MGIKVVSLLAHFWNNSHGSSFELSVQTASSSSHQGFVRAPVLFEGTCLLSAGLDGHRSVWGVPCAIRISRVSARSSGLKDSVAACRAGWSCLPANLGVILHLLFPVAAVEKRALGVCLRGSPVFSLQVALRRLLCLQRFAALLRTRCGSPPDHPAWSVVCTLGFISLGGVRSDTSFSLVFPLPSGSQLRLRQNFPVCIY